VKSGILVWYYTLLAFIAGQTVEPINICKEKTLKLNKGYSGVISHTKSTQAPYKCSLKIETAEETLFMVVGVNPRGKRRFCKALQLDNKRFCVDGVTPGHLMRVNGVPGITISTLSNTENFHFQFFTSSKHIILN